MKVAMIAVGLLLYVLSLAIPGEQWYLSFSAGVLTGLSIVRAIMGFSNQDRSLAMRQYSSDSEVEAATKRVLKAAGNGRPGRLIRIRPLLNREYL
jgi:hypothetical protein